MTVTATARLKLREATEDDAPFILELQSDPAFRANIGDRGVHDLASARGYIADSLLSSYRRHGFGLWMLEPPGSHQPLGMCGLLRRDSHPDVEIGFALLPAARGQGYAREAAAAVLALGLGRFALERIIALTTPQNLASIRVLESLGFRYLHMASLTPGEPTRLYEFRRP